MCTLINIFADLDDTDPELECTSCGMVFTLFWQRNLIYNQPEYCPFCGDEVEEIQW